MATIVNGSNRINYRLVCHECGSTDIRDCEDHFECGICYKRNEKMPPSEIELPPTSPPELMETMEMLGGQNLTPVDIETPVVLKKALDGWEIIDIVVTDNREGWANSFLKVLEACWAGDNFRADVSKVRPRGSRLLTMGGRASGPEPLMEHLFMLNTSNAGVAQSAEQGFRKAEAVGSTPIPSSTGLSRDQQQLVADIVHHRVAIEDNRKASDTAKATLREEEFKFKMAKTTAENSIAHCAGQMKYHMEQLLLAEGNLKQSVLNDVLVKGATAPEPTPSEPKEEFDYDDQIGRAG